MKKIIKIIAISMGSIIGSIVFGILLIFLLGVLQPNNDAGESSISIDVQQPNGSTEDIGKIGGVPEASEEKLHYYNSLEDALAKAPGIDGEYAYLRKIHQVVKRFESKKYAELFYTSIYDKNTAGFNAVTFKVRKGANGKRQYAPMTIAPVESVRGAWISLSHGGLKGAVESILQLSNFANEFNVDNPRKAKFVWGLSTFSEIHTLRIEGQAPTEIIPYQMFGKEKYFWYYADLKSKKPSSQLEVTVKEPKR